MEIILYILLAILLIDYLIFRIRQNKINSLSLSLFYEILEIFKTNRERFNLIEKTLDMYLTAKEDNFDKGTDRSKDIRKGKRVKRG